MTGHTNNSTDYLDLIELAKANISGQMRHKLVQQAQHRLVDRLLENGLIAPEDALDLAM